MLFLHYVTYLCLLLHTSGIDVFSHTVMLGHVAHSDVILTHFSPNTELSSCAEADKVR